MPAKGEFELTYWGGPDNPAPCGGVNYSAPYTAIPANDLAPGSVNTQNINGFLCASPWVANPPFSTSFAAGEYVLGIFQFNDSGEGAAGGPSGNENGATIEHRVLIISNVAVYVGAFGSSNSGAQLPLGTLSVIHTWTAPEINKAYMYPGNTVSFIQSNNMVYFTGWMLVGLFAYGVVSPPGSPAFVHCTAYVAGAFIAELAGRLVIAECLFPGGGGTGTAVQPTIAWSGVGIFGQAWDGNAAHDVWNPANQAFFNGNIGGFNLLGDVPDQITGMGTVGQSIIIVRLNGLTQQDPNSTFSNSGIQPYNWYHMWSSNQGVGGFPGTVAQWGQMLIFKSSDNVYSLSMSAGLSPLGAKVIPKIAADQRMIQNLPTVSSSLNAGAQTFGFLAITWNFSTTYTVAGQLHYLLTVNAYTTDVNASPSQQKIFCYGYDLNVADGSWHFWDFGQYYKQTQIGAGFLCFSCPVVPTQIDYGNITPASPNQNIGTTTLPSFLMFGAFTSFGPLVNSSAIFGGVFQLVPFDYDFNTNPITTFITLLYPVLSLPSPTIVFRGETLSLGHKISTRRLRLQADNAPLPNVVANAQQQAQVTFTGAGANSKAQSPVINMQGNLAPTGLAIQTYYGDAVLSDEMVQPSLTSVFSTTTPWQTLCAFRIASASLIGIDATGTTQ